MNPPVKIEKLHALWAADCHWDQTEPHTALNNIPRLHAKYLNIHSWHSFYVKKLKKDYTKTRFFWLEYYRGDHNTNEELLEQHKLEPFDKEAGKDINQYIDSRKELIDMLTSIDYNDQIVDYCDKVLKEINSRTWQLRSYIDYLKWAQEAPRK